MYKDNQTCDVCKKNKGDYYFYLPCLNCKSEMIICVECFSIQVEDGSNCTSCIRLEKINYYLEK